MKKRIVVFAAAICLMLAMIPTVMAAEEPMLIDIDSYNNSLDEAVAAVPDNGTAIITLGEGTYTLADNIIINAGKDITITGAGKDKTTIVSDSATYSCVI